MMYRSRSMIEITNRSVTPYKEVCYIETYWPDGALSRASGTVVGSNDVLTALHVVYSAEHGGWATQVTVAPGADIDSQNFSAPYGVYYASDWVGRVDNGWDTDGNGRLSWNESGQDLAVISLNVNLGALTETLGTSPAIGDFQGTVLGYPARGTGLMEASGDVTSFPEYPVYYIDTGLGAGASGGPLLDESSGTPLIRGVLSGGDDADTYSIYAGLDSSNWFWYNQTINSNDSLLWNTESHAIGAGIVSGSSQADIFYESRLPAETSLINGYKGGDILSLAGYSNEYNRTVDSSSTDILHITDLYYGTQLAIEDVNVLSFYDKDVYVLSEDQAQIARLYTIFERTPDYSGLEFWLGLSAQGTSLNRIADIFTDTPEFTTRYNAVDNQGYANQLYENILGREGEAGGLEYWTQSLNTGQTTRADAMIFFTQSEENQSITESASGFIQIVGHSDWV